MKKLVIFLSGVSIMLVIAGCKTTNADKYLTDRERDFADIFTLTFGKAYGAYAHAGPVSVGLYSGDDITGLRGGVFIPPKMMVSSVGECFEINDDDFYIFPLGIGGFNPLLNANSSNFSYWTTNFNEKFASQCMDKIDKPTYRHKTGMDFSAFGLSFYDPQCPGFRHSLQHYTNVELAGGLLFGLRVGFNPGELLDFLLGWTTMDIFDDDLELKEPPCICVIEKKERLKRMDDFYKKYGYYPISSFGTISSETEKEYNPATGRIEHKGIYNDCGYLDCPGHSSSTHRCH